MSFPSLSDPKMPIGDVLKVVGHSGMVLESESHVQYALLPLDEEVIDLLIERSPEFRAHCREIRGRMDSGEFQTHADVKRQLLSE